MNAYGLRYRQTDIYVTFLLHLIKAVSKEVAFIFHRGDGKALGEAEKAYRIRPVRPCPYRFRCRKCSSFFSLYSVVYSVPQLRKVPFKRQEGRGKTSGRSVGKLKQRH